MDIFGYIKSFYSSIIWNQMLSTSYRRVVFSSQNVLKNIFELHAHILKVDLFQMKIWIFSLLSKNGGWYGNAGPTIPTIPLGNRSCRARPLCLRHVLSNSQQPQLVLFYKICLVLLSIGLCISSIQQTQNLVIPKCGRCLVGEVLSFKRGKREESNYERNGEGSASDIWAWASWQGERWFSRLICKLPQQAKGRPQMLSHILLYVGPTVVLRLAVKQK